MPTFDFLCDCGFGAEISVTVVENDVIDEDGGIECPQCEGTMKKLPSVLNYQFAKVPNSRGKLQPGGKRELRQMMQRRFRKREERLESMPKYMQDRMVKFMEKYNVRRTPPPAPPGD
jgi:hypothetical protein